MSRYLCWAIIGGFVCTSLALCVTAGLAVNFAPSQLIGCLVCLGARQYVMVRMPQWRGDVADIFELIAQLILVSMFGAIASYAIAAMTSGYADAQLVAWDKMIGFDWLAAYRFVESYPLLAMLLGIAYLSMFLSPLIVIVGLCFHGKAGHARAMLATYVAALCVTLIGFAFFAAKTPLNYLIDGPAGHIPATGNLHTPTIEALRAGTLTTIDTSQLVGLIAFPSFHAASAILFIGFAWPVRWLRMVMILTNGAMLVATPVEGAHYLIDVIAGIALGAAFVLVASRWRSIAQAGSAFAAGRAWIPAMRPVRSESSLGKKTAELR